jgi:EAL domain-containing protein (putative c-di-GMP-specific phosphodiesterase class I)
VQPERFLPLAEEIGLIASVDEAVQARAFADVGRWRAAGHSDLKLSINVSPGQLEQDAFADRLLAALGAAGLDPDAVRLELGENTLMRDIDIIVPRLKELRRQGATIVIDDYGTGFSSLAQLRQFPIDAVKIDRAFVADIRHDQGGASIIDAIVAMCRSLELGLLAEGVEHANQLRYLCAQGCRELQGVLFSPPVAADSIAGLLARQPFPDMMVRDGG